MNMELAEERCIRYLKGMSRPLMPFRAVLSYVREDEACSGITEDILLAFLGNHPDFRVMEVPGMALDPHAAPNWQELGLPTGPLVALRARIPSDREMASFIVAEFDTMLDALATALTDARAEGNQDRIDQITRLLFRAKKLRERMRRFE